MAIKIGTVTTLNSSNWKVIPDDRQKQVETIGGVEVQDFGRVPEGDKYTCNIEVSNDDAEIIFYYWETRTRVTVINEAGKVHENIRVIVKDYGHIQEYEKDYYKMTVEFWRK